MNEKVKMQNIFDIADYFLSLQDEDCEDYISNLKLQKLCYYAQGFHLANSGLRLFDNDIEAWQHGPVVPELYKKYKTYGAGILPMSENFTSKKISLENQELLEYIYGRYGQYSAWKLRNMTNAELPWKKAKHKQNLVIPDKDLVAFFKTQLD